MVEVEMSNVDALKNLDRVAQNLVGKEVARPDKTMGHASGLEFEKLVHKEIVNKFPNRAFRHFELLNEIYGANSQVKSVDERYDLLGPPSLQFLLRRGKAATKSWTVKKQFEEKQNDTAETIILPNAKLRIEPDRGNPSILVDVKTQDSEKSAQAPNIISAEKIANACRISLENEKFLPFDIAYVCVKWVKKPKMLACTEAKVVTLTRIQPSELYINWVAAQQIQFHPFDVDQSFTGNGLEWARAFLETFCDQLSGRIRKENLKLQSFLKVIS
jgi:type II restriction enzyme